MNERDPKNWKKSVQHPSDEDLLCFIDGELPSASSESLRLHLEACWKCRNRAEKFQAAISLFVDYRSQVLQPLTEVPNNWRGFDPRLREASEAVVPPTVWQRWRAAFSRLQRQISSIDIRVVRLTTISAATVLLGGVGFYLMFISSQTVVSAEELLERAAVARESEVKNSTGPVVYQKLRITRRTSEGESTTNVELWQDLDNARFKRSVIAADPANAHIDLEQIMRNSGYEPPPLSVAAFRAWREKLSTKTDRVEEITLDEGVHALRLETQVGFEPPDRQIVSSALFVRSRDYHPIGQTFRVKTSEGDLFFELRELSFAVMNLDSLKADFFADAIPTIASVRPAASPSVPEEAEEKANTNLRPVSEPGMVTGGVAAPELEVEVLNLLHTAGADLGEQIEVKRIPNGPVVITGVVETPDRKNQILNALAPVRSNPTVRIEINTAAEEIARQKQSKVQPKPSVERVEVESDMFPAEGDVRAYLGRQGRESDQAVKQFAASTTGRSSRAMNYLYAMRRLKLQFSTADLQKLSPEARTKWLGLVRSHARSYQNEIAALNRELRPVFGGSSGGGVMNIGSDSELLQSIERLFVAGSSGHQLIRQAFTTSSGQASTNALRSAQFWRLMNEAESLARSIAVARVK